MVVVEVDEGTVTILKVPMKKVCNMSGYVNAENVFEVKNLLEQAKEKLGDYDTKKMPVDLYVRHVNLVNSINASLYFVDEVMKGSTKRK